jgi:2-polyprenyl-3-methyl-5-hydroxy-6-metoxy-1,4-benzoquinol methylase
LHTRWVSTEHKRVQQYKGITIHADENVHEQCAALLARLLSPGATVLDIGAGAGAFSLRLADTGYAVTALDVDREKWAAEGVPFIEGDLNNGVPDSVEGTFDCVCCLEVIEHVENPWQLLREARSILNPGGVLLISTPNVSSFLSRAYFLRLGQFHQFQAPDLEYGHINPVTLFELETIAATAGLRIEQVEPGGYLPLLDFSCGPSLRRNALRLLSYVVSRGAKLGWCLICVLRPLERIGGAR